MTVVVSIVGTTGNTKEVVSDSMESNEASKCDDARDELAGVMLG